MYEYDYHVIVDFEFNPVLDTDKKAKQLLKNEIIEIGAVKLDKYLNVIDRFKCFIRPEYNYQIMPTISKLTGIHTTTAFKAESFGPTLKEFAEWIGTEKNTRIYSWSENDLKQLIRESRFKNVCVPDCFHRWVDIQKIFPKMMKMDNCRRKKIALKEAVLYLGIDLNNKKAHDALYDAEVETEILKFFLTGEYRHQVNSLNRLTEPTCTTTVGDVCGGILMTLLLEMEAA